MKKFLLSSLGFYFILFITTSLVFLRQQQLSVALDRDGVTYLQAAAGFLNQGWVGAIALKQQATWPFYSILIALFSKLTLLPIPLAAAVIDFLLVLVTVGCFVHIVALINGSTLIRYIALLAILSWHSFTKYFPDILRDHGFNCFLLLSVIAFYHFMRACQWRYAVLWWLSLGVAFLFRLEAIVYLLLVPLSFLLFSANKSCWYGVAKLYLLPGVLVFIAILCQKTLLSGALRFQYIFQQLTQVFGAIQGHWVLNIDKLSQVVFPHTHFVSLGLFAAVCAVFLCLLLESFGALGILSLVFLARNRRQCLENAQWCFVLCYGVVATLILALFFFEYFFLSGRYVIQLGLFVMMTVPFVLREVRGQFKGVWFSRSGVWLGLFCLALMCNIIASSFHFGRNNSWVSIEAGEWIKQNLPADSKITTNSKRISYYASRDDSLSFGKVWQRASMNESMAYLLNKTSWYCSDYLVFVGNMEEFDRTYTVLVQRHLLSEKIKQFDADSRYGAVVARVDPDACQAH